MDNQKLHQELAVFHPDLLPEALDCVVTDLASRYSRAEALANVRYGGTPPAVREVACRLRDDGREEHRKPALGSLAARCPHAVCLLDPFRRHADALDCGDAAAGGA